MAFADDVELKALQNLTMTRALWLLHIPTRLAFATNNTQRYRNADE